MITLNTPEEDARIILGPCANGELERLVLELKRFGNNGRLVLDNGFFERYRRKPDKKDLVFQALKEKFIGASDNDIRELLRKGISTKDFERQADETLRRVQKANLRGYFIKLYHGQGILDNPNLDDNKIISDAPYQFILVNSNRFCANAGFFPYPKRIEVCQIQGFSGCERELEPLKWSRLLIRSIYDWACSNGIPETDVAPYKRNGWGSVMYNSRGNSHLVYDVTAEREGFSYDEARQLFVRRIGGEK